MTDSKINQKKPCLLQSALIKIDAWDNDYSIPSIWFDPFTHTHTHSQSPTVYKLAHEFTQISVLGGTLEGGAGGGVGGYGRN